MTRRRTRSDLSKAALTGVVAGLAASFVMNAFQAAIGHFEPDNDGDAPEPATEQAADRVAELAGTSLGDLERPVAGNAVHYAVGALLGAGYAVATEYEPRAAAGGGAAFGIVTAAVLDDVVVPVAGLSAAPWAFPATTHVYGLASHIVFGMTTEAVRRLLRRR
ncbi:DUF1440 domain-containing protein [Sphingomonas montana]|uniref:DUF1440 domain-containing protein n=1 Tax=Sphingomonas montana TaxID=1843236 RepID=UPI00096F7D5C|nr:DUF1440 domain-containing protein [Sphingomonas montana]